MVCAHFCSHCDDKRMILICMKENRKCDNAETDQIAFLE
jgi:hypothetical protein